MTRKKPQPVRRKRWYVGILQGSRTTFATAADVPNDPLWQSAYAAIIGPFLTRRGATFMARSGGQNPNCQTVRDAERLARKAWKSRRIRK